MKAISIQSQECFNRGFTIIELTMAIALIGILAAIGIPRLLPYVQSAEHAEAFAITSTVRRSVEEYYAYHGQFPVDNGAAGVAKPEAVRGKYISRSEVKNGAIHLLFRRGKESGHILTLRPAIREGYPPDGMIWWLCGHEKPADGLIAFGENLTDLGSDTLEGPCKGEQ